MCLSIAESIQISTYRILCKITLNTNWLIYFVLVNHVYRSLVHFVAVIAIQSITQRIALNSHFIGQTNATKFTSVAIYMVVHVLGHYAHLFCAVIIQRINAFAANRAFRSVLGKIVPDTIYQTFVDGKLFTFEILRTYAAAETFGMIVVV